MRELLGIAMYLIPFVIMTFFMWKDIGLKNTIMCYAIVFLVALCFYCGNILLSKDVERGNLKEGVESPIRINQQENNRIERQYHGNR